MNCNPTIEKPQIPFYTAGFPSLVGLRLAVFPFKMNKSACQASNYRDTHKIYWRTHWQPNECAVPNVSPRWAIFVTQPMNGSVAPAAQSHESSWELFRTQKASIEDGFSHNLGFRYLTHAHIGMIYMLSEVYRLPRNPQESALLAIPAPKNPLSHTHTVSLFLINYDIDATNGSFASINKAKKDVSNDPSPRKPAHLENIWRASVETSRLSLLNSRRDSKRQQIGGSDFCHFEDFRPNNQNSRVPVRMAGKGTEVGSQESGPMAAFVVPPIQQGRSHMNPETECLICSQDRNDHNNVVCDAVRSVLHKRIKRAEESILHRGPKQESEDHWIRGGTVA